MKKSLMLGLMAIWMIPACSQTESFTQRFYETYESYREPALGKRRIKHTDLQPLIDAVAARPGFEVTTVGTSLQGRPLRLISTGTGNTDVFLWSQMHGDEPTATQAIFDILNFLKSGDFAEEKQELLSKVRIHFLPMLNPDGAEVFQRRNTLGIDIICIMNIYSGWFCGTEGLEPLLISDKVIRRIPDEIRLVFRHQI